MKTLTKILTTAAMMSLGASDVGCNRSAPAETAASSGKGCDHRPGKGGDVPAARSGSRFTAKPAAAPANVAARMSL